MPNLKGTPSIPKRQLKTYNISLLFHIREREQSKKINKWSILFSTWLCFLPHRSSHNVQALSLTPFRTRLKTFPLRLLLPSISRTVSVCPIASLIGSAASLVPDKQKIMVQVINTYIVHTVRIPLDSLR